jgi:hypothetical protein
MDTYDPKDVLVIVGGFALSGFAPDTFVEVVRNADAMTLVMGADGQGVRTKSADRSGRITIRLLQTSESNAILDAFANADELDGSGAVPAMVKDNRGLILHAAEQAWVVKKPSSEFGGSESQPREWVLESDNIAMVEGGY